jgi:hypothetical protein
LGSLQSSTSSSSRSSSPHPTGRRFRRGSSGSLLYEIDPTVTAISTMLIAVAVIGLGVVAAVRWMLGVRGGASAATLEEPQGAHAI